MKLRSWNWWKIGFFVMLLVFEVTREIAVIASPAPPQFAIGTPMVYRSPDGDFITATGSLERVDGPNDLLRNAVAIECHRDTSSCVMATTNDLMGYISVPHIDWRHATFTDTGVEFTDDVPFCDSLFIRIDAIHSATTAVRTSKNNPDPSCARHTPRLEMRLGAIVPTSR